AKYEPNQLNVPTDFPGIGFDEPLLPLSAEERAAKALNNLQIRIRLNGARDTISSKGKRRRRDVYLHTPYTGEKTQNYLSAEDSEPLLAIYDKAAIDGIPLDGEFLLRFEPAPKSDDEEDDD